MRNGLAPFQSVMYKPDGSIVTDLSEADLEGVLASSEGIIWVALTTEWPESQRILREVMRFHPLAVDDCLNGRVDTPKVDDHGDYLFIVSQTVGETREGDRLHLEELDMFLGRNYLVTVKPDGTMPSIDALFSDAKTGAFLLRRGPDFLAHSILDVIVDELLPAVETLDEALDDLEQRIIERPEKDLLAQVMLMKRNTLRLRRAILPQRDMVNRLSRGEFETLIQPAALIFFRDVYDHIVRVESMLEGLRDLADGALSSYLSAINNRMNEIMKAMSVVAVIFLPLTLIASVFGTNLDYSALGLELRGGFYWMLGTMLAMAAAMVIFFRRRGWF